MGKIKNAAMRNLFCCYYAKTGDVAEAARLAGFPKETAVAEGAALLRQGSCRKLVDSYRACLQNNPAALVRSGLERLAFGKTNDAVQLLFLDEFPTEETLAQLDLFGVSSIKKDKSGGMEIHFFDRLKALASLYEYSGDADGKAAAHALLAALTDTEEDEM